MAFRFRELPWYLQTLLFFLVAVGVYAAGELLSFSPVKTAVDTRTQKERDLAQLVADVSELQAVRQDHQAFQTRLKASEEQLARLRTLIPEKKQTDDFMRLIQASALSAQVSVRRITAKAVVYQTKGYAEMPFELELDGPYYNVMEFYRRLGGSTRIVNAGNVKLAGFDPTKAKQVQYLSGTTVAGTCMVVTFYTPSEAELAALAPPTKR